MLRLWDIRFAVQRHSAAPIHRQIADHIVTHIKMGHLSAGMALPGSRELAATLNINRKTAIHAYDELIAAGWLECSNKRGTFVAKLHPPHTPIPAKAKLVEIGHATSIYPHKDVTSNLTARSIDFTVQQPLSFALPTDLLIKASKQAYILANKRQDILPLAYDLKSIIAQWLHMEKSMPIHTDQVAIVASKTIALWLCAKQLVAEGGYLAIGNQTSTHTQQALVSAGVPLLKVKENTHGIQLDDLEKLCINYHVRALYLPNDTLLTQETDNTKQALISLAQRLDFLIIEEESPVELSQYLGEHPPANVQFNERIIYISGFSEWVFPDISLAYVVANAPFIANLMQTYKTTCNQSTRINELTIHTLIQTGELKRHLKRVGRQFQQKKKLIYELLTRKPLQHANLNERKMVDTVATEIGFTKFGIKVQLSFSSTNPSSFQYASNSALIGTLMSKAHQHQLVLTAPELNLQQAGSYSLWLHFLHLNDQEITEGIARLQRLMDDFTVIPAITQLYPQAKN